MHDRTKPTAGYTDRTMECITAIERTRDKTNHSRPSSRRTLNANYPSSAVHQGSMCLSFISYRSILHLPTLFLRLLCLMCVNGQYFLSHPAIPLSNNNILLSNNNNSCVSIHTYYYMQTHIHILFAFLTDTTTVHDVWLLLPTLLCYHVIVLTTTPRPWPAWPA